MTGKALSGHFYFFPLSFCVGVLALVVAMEEKNDLVSACTCAHRCRFMASIDADSGESNIEVTPLILSTS